MRRLRGHHRGAGRVAGFTAVAMQVNDLVKVGKGGQIGGMTLGATLVGIDVDCLVGAGQLDGVQVAAAVTVGAHLTGTGLASGNGVAYRVGQSVMAVADRAGVAAGLADMDAIDDVNRIVAPTAVQVGVDLMVVAGMGAVLIGVAGGAEDIIRAGNGGGNNAVIGR